MSGPVDLTMPVAVQRQRHVESGRPRAHREGVDRDKRISAVAVAREEADVAMSCVPLRFRPNPVVRRPRRSARLVNRRAAKWDLPIKTALRQRVAVDIAPLVGFGELLQNPRGHEALDLHAMLTEVGAVARHAPNRSPCSPLGSQPTRQSQRPRRCVIKESFEPAVAETDGLEGEIQGEQPDVPADAKALSQRLTSHGRQSSGSRHAT